MLISRVDVVTGGASAVYGSDAVTGVVNFVLDKKFDGFKFDINTGISTYADAMSYNLGAAAGTDLFGGRGHFETAVEYRHRDPVNQSARPYGPDDPSGVGWRSGHRHGGQSLQLDRQCPPSQLHLRRPGPGLRAGLSAGQPAAVQRPTACSRPSSPASAAPRMPRAIPPPAPAISTRAATAPTTPMARCSTAITRARCSAASAMT